MGEDCLAGQTMKVPSMLHLNQPEHEPTVILDLETDLLVQHNDGFAHSTVISARVGRLQLPDVDPEGSASSDGVQTVSPHP